MLEASEQRTGRWTLRETERRWDPPPLPWANSSLGAASRFIRLPARAHACTAPWGQDLKFMCGIMFPPPLPLIIPQWDLQKVNQVACQGPCLYSPLGS